ncbi:MAG: ubiquinone biosynthesis regulatory protein kinase UbiB, partial [Gammaproteobacteria bacterium]|nr:ubiquinone biosynthesis regulatory protein kinase UbiB [Gammaproteobacteria bacterium]
QLYPELDLWRTAKPFLEQWVRERVGGRAILRELKQQAPRWAETLPRLPVLLHDVLKQSSEGQLQMRLTSEDLTEIRREIRRANRRTVQSVVGAALVISAAAVYGLSGYQPHMVWGAPLMSWVLGGLGLYLIVSGAGD